MHVNDIAAHNGADPKKLGIYYPTIANVNDGLIASHSTHPSLLGNKPLVQRGGA